MTAARWVIKRAEPTEEMRSIGGWTIGAAYDQLPQDDVADAAAVDTYRAMLQASPSPLDDAELVEGIARVLAVADNKDPDAPAWIQYPGATSFGICWRDQYADKARDVIRYLSARSKGETAS